MRLVFTPHGWDVYTFWLTADRATLKRISDEHRLVYLVDGDDVVILQARYLY
jgi:toxin YoeB